MDTITWNWLWFALVFVAGGYLLSRLRDPAGGGSGPVKDDAPPHSPSDDGRPDAQRAPPHRNPAPVIDPVTRESVRIATAPAFFYQGRVYFFASVRSRERFEASPRAYLQPRNDGPQDPGPTIDRTGGARPVRARRVSSGGTPTRGGGEARPDSPQGQSWNQQGARDGR
jgi:YHS domain-containing protein